MTYEQMVEFSAFWGMIFFITLFFSVLVYAFWPKSKKRFEEAAQIPFKEKE
jgi:cytochrome c oxidase cbb3-type subunit 4